jgi:hypothetical protein
MSAFFGSGANTHVHQTKKNNIPKMSKLLCLLILGKIYFVKWMAM